jgi:hypothetical protein
MVKSTTNYAIIGSTMVQHLPCHPKVRGLSLAPTTRARWDKMVKATPNYAVSGSALVQH